MISDGVLLPLDSRF